MKRRYIGITYPNIFIFNWMYKLWKIIFCKRHMHLFDEVLSETHYLICDACGFRINIEEHDKNSDENSNEKIVVCHSFTVDDSLEIPRSK